MQVKKENVVENVMLVYAQTVVSVSTVINQSLEVEIL